MKKAVFALMLAAVAAVCLGCISQPEEAGGLTTLRIGYQPSTHQVAEMVASDMGWWADDLRPLGINRIEEKLFETGPPEMQAMLAGDLDVAYVGTAPPITAIAQGLDAKIVAGANINGSDVVFAPGLEYTGPESFEGMSIATFPPGSIQDLVLKKWLGDNGIDISDVRILPMGPGEAVSAISAGQVDSVFLPHPSPTTVEMEGKGETVLQSGEMWPDHACCSIVVRGKLLREHPEIVEQIVRTHIRATDYANAHPEEAARIYAEKTGQDVDVARRSLETWDGKLISDPHIQVPSTLEYAATDYDLGYIRRELSRDDLFDTSFFDEVV